MKTIAYILKTRGNPIWSVTSESSVDAAAQLMIEKETGALPVLEKGKLVGIVSEKDYLTKVAINGRSPKDMKVKEIMADSAVTIEPEQTIEKCLALMTEKDIQYLPVISDDCLVGIVSIDDLFKTVLTDQKVLIQKLEKHILETRRFI